MKKFIQYMMMDLNSSGLIPTINQGIEHLYDVVKSYQSKK
jgi:hypothetical protein